MQIKNVHIWVWMHGHYLWKAVYDPQRRSLTIFNEYDEMVIRRTGLTDQQVKNLEFAFLCIGAKRIDNHKEPFTYL
ncbi:MAG: hypothetical protein QXL17_07530 [Candidatus Thermoplasmatota archaeon]